MSGAMCSCGHTRASHAPGRCVGSTGPECNRAPLEPPVPSVLVDADTAKPTLLDVVRVLLNSYSDYGALIWLNSGNRAWPMTGWLKLRTVALQEVPFWSPRQMIDAGRIAEVLEVAERLENGGG